MPSAKHAETKGEATRRGLLEAAIERFGRDGFKATSLTDVARDAGVGNTVPYAYFANKEALFLAALDQDTAGVISETQERILDHHRDADWHDALSEALLGAVDRHPLAQRVLAGLEPHVTDRMIDLPALEDLRTTIAERLAEDQRAGTVRSDIDVSDIASGVVTIWISLLMSTIQFGRERVTELGTGVLAVFEAALAPAPPAD